MVVTRSVFKMGWVFLGLLALAVQAFAVWPPSTSLELESNAPSNDGATKIVRMVASQREATMAKLQADELRLQSILHDLSEDEQALNRLSVVREPDSKRTAAQEQ
jgi:hypothetical protein